MRYLDSGKIIVDNLEELREIVLAKEIDLALIDIKASRLTSLDYVFKNINKINGSISNWDVSDIESLQYSFAYSNLDLDLSKWNTYNFKILKSTFEHSYFNGDISQWDVSSCNNMNAMFYRSKFNGDISQWDVSKVRDANWMFGGSLFNEDISLWDVSNIENFNSMFYDSQFNRDISKWNISNGKDFCWAFAYAKFDGDISQWKFDKNNDCENIFYDNFKFIEKYHNGNEIPNYSEDFLEWFENNKDNIYDIYHNLNNETKIEIDDYLLSFELNNKDLN